MCVLEKQSLAAWRSSRPGWLVDKPQIKHTETAGKQQAGSETGAKYAACDNINEHAECPVDLRVSFLKQRSMVGRRRSRRVW